VGTYTIFLHATDDNSVLAAATLSHEVSFVLTILPANAPPVFTAQADRTLDNFSGSQSVTYAVTDAEGDAYTLAIDITSCAAFCTKNEGSGVVTFNPTLDAHAGTYAVSAVATQTSLVTNTGTLVFNIIVNPINIAPVVAAMAAVSYTVGDATLVITSSAVTDANAGDTLTLGFGDASLATSLPTFAT